MHAPEAAELSRFLVSYVYIYSRNLGTSSYSKIHKYTFIVSNSIHQESRYICKYNFDAHLF